MSSAVRSFTKLYKRNFGISWNFYKKGINYACTEDWTCKDKFATLRMFPKRFYHSFILQMTVIYSRRCWTQVHLCDFETQENVWIRVKQGRAPFVISRAAIKSPNFVSIENFWSCLTWAQKWVNIEAMSYIWQSFCSGTSYCLEFSTSSNSHAARENLPHLVALWNLSKTW